MNCLIELPPKDVPSSLLLGSQGAVGINQLVRQCASAWFDAGFDSSFDWENDPDADTIKHPQYFPPFYDNMARLLQRANLAISRAGAVPLKLAVTGTPAILFPTQQKITKLIMWQSSRQLVPRWYFAKRK